MTIGERIKQHRTEQGLSLRALAARSGVSNPFISQVERGQGISVEKLMMIAKALKVRTSVLMGEK